MIQKEIITVQNIKQRLQNHYKNVISIPANIVEKWDVSQANDGSVIAYAENDGNGGYIITICSDGKTYLNGTYDYLFSLFQH